MSVEAALRCAGKVRHPDLAAARAGLRRTKVRGVEAYRCGACHGWHIGRARDAAIERAREGR